MRWSLELVSGPEIEPVTLAEAIEHLREFSSIPESTEDRITGLIEAAREWVEDYTGQVLVDQTWRLSIDQNDTWLDESTSTEDDDDVPAIYLRKSPILAIVSLETIDADGDATEIGVGEYDLRSEDSKWPYLVPTSTATWQDSNLRITFRAGYADQTGSPQTGAEVVPERFKQAMKLWLEANYDRDEKLMKSLLEFAEKVAKPLKTHVGFA